jgi:hypothetical protein
MAQAKRAKKPRYAIALLFGLAYLGFMVWGQIMARSIPGSSARSALLGASTEAIAPLGIAFMIGTLWLFGSDLAALAFSQAEVAMLFTAPVTRRELIIYKLVRMQIGVIISSLIWVFLLRRGGSELPALARLLTCWVLFATLGLHRLGAALVLAKSHAHKAETGRRRWLPQMISFAIVLLIVSRTMTSSIAANDSANPFSFLDTIGHVLSTPQARFVLYPFHLMIAPMFAVTLGAWGQAVLISFAVLVVHVWWVLHTDTAFEEAAIAASERQARLLASMRSRQRGVTIPQAKAGERTIALSSTGRPALAILWKNMLALKRQFSLGAMGRPLIIAIVFAAAGMKAVHDPAHIVAIAAAYVAGMLVISGGQVMRNDLRSDMLHLPLLKTLPLRGSDIVLAEVASSTLPLAAIQVVLIGVAGIAEGVARTPSPIPLTIRTGILIAAPIVVIAIDAAMLSVTNGMAVLFPGWMRLGPTGAAGFEVIGQVMLSMFAMFFGFVLLMALPAAAGIAAYLVLGGTPFVATIAAGLAGSVIVGLEVYAMVLVLGRAFEKAEPAQVAQ